MLSLTVDKWNKIIIINRETKEVIGDIRLGENQFGNYAEIAFNFDKKYEIIRSNAKCMSPKQPR